MLLHNFWMESGDKTFHGLVTEDEYRKNSWNLRKS